MIVAMAFFAVTGLWIYRYLKSTFLLLERLKESAPHIWEQLGRPEKVRYRKHNAGLGYHVNYTIQPIWPWLKWVWEADLHGLDSGLGRDLRQTSKLLKQSSGLFLITFLVFFYTIVISPLH